MALLTQLTLEQARPLARAYGVEVADCEPLALGSVNSNFRVQERGGRRLFARLYEEQGLDGAQRELALLSALARAGVPVPEPLPRSGELPRHEGKPFVVFPWVEGESLCLARVEPNACRKLGAALAKVHAASATAPALGPGRFAPRDMLERVARVERDPAARRLTADLAQIRALYARLEPLRDRSLPSGVVHGDLFRDNVLWENGELSALLDFESAFQGPFVYDLLVTIAAWCYGDAFRLEHARALVAGYESVRRLEPGERAATRVEGALGCLRFATSRITDFELRATAGAPPARDYRRFFARLEAIEAGALDEIFAV